MDRILPKVAEQGCATDNLICAEDLPEGRPGPLAIYQCFVNLVTYPPDAVVKVGGTAPEILESKVAGCVSVGVAMSGNAAGLPPEDLGSLDATAIQTLEHRATGRLTASWADHVIDTLADFPAQLDRLEQ